MLEIEHRLFCFQEAGILNIDDLGTLALVLFSFSFLYACESDSLREPGRHVGEPVWPVGAKLTHGQSGPVGIHGVDLTHKAIQPGDGGLDWMALIVIKKIPAVEHSVLSPLRMNNT